MDKINEKYYPKDGFLMELDATQGANKIDISERERNISIVKTNYRYWNSMSNFKSQNNYDDDNFRQIVQIDLDLILCYYYIIE